MAIKNEKIRNTLQSIAELRRYLLVEHPSLLKSTGPSLVQAEVEIFTIWNELAA